MRRRCKTVLFSLPDAVLHAIHKLNDAGFEAYVVGGCVRDSLMDTTPEDWDITTSATPAEMQIVFSECRCIETGLQHGTLTVLINNVPLEITTYRVDGNYSDGRHPDTVTFTRSLAEDLRRRDFTINAMAYHPSVGLVDFYGGQADIQTGVIRCVGEPERRFHEDALRILRALRFASVLGFAIDADTAAALKALSPALRCISAERIAVEFKKLLCGKNVVEIFTDYRDVISEFLPEIKACDNFRLLSRVAAVPRVRLAALFHSAAVSAEQAAVALHRLRLDNQIIREVSLLLAPITKGVYTEDAFLLRLLNRLGPELIFDYLTMREFDRTTVLRVKHLLSDNACYCLSMLDISGDDVIATGVTPGPRVGEALHDLLSAVMDGDCPNEKVALLKHLSKMKRPVQ